jgi:hypothetical protein
MSNRKAFKTLAAGVAAAGMLYAGMVVAATPKPEPRILNLRAFAKLYGYVKYFHPSDEASQIDWDVFSVYGAGRVKDAESQEDLETALKDLFLPLAPTIEIYAKGQEPGDPLVGLPDDTSDLKVVAWQHKGVGLRTDAPGLYASVRLNSKMTSPPPGHGFGTVTQSIDAAPYRGKDIKLRAFVRTHVEGPGNQGQVWLRVDREGGRMGFFDNMDDRPIRSPGWRVYEIQGHVAGDATGMSFGCFLRGSGSVWVDDFRLFARRNDAGWDRVEIENPGFEKAHGNGRPEGWFASSPGYTYRLDESSPHTGKMCMLIEYRPGEYTAELFDQHPEVGEVVRKKLCRGLFCQVPLALYREGGRTIGRREDYPFESLMSDLEARSAPEFGAEDEDVRLGAVVIAWNVFQHFYPYFDVVDVDWDKELTRALVSATEDENERDFYYTLSRLTAGLQDGHAQVAHRLQTGWAGPPFLVDWIEDHAIIVHSADTAKFRVGDIIEAVDGVPAGQALREAEEYVSGSPQWKRFKALQHFGFGDQGTAVRFTIQRDGLMLEVEAARETRDLTAPSARSPLEEIRPGVYYVNLSQADMDTIEKRMQDLALAKGIVFDLRGYPKGNHGVISHLLDRPDTSRAWMKIPKIIYPDQESLVGYVEHGWGLRPEKPRIEAKAVFLTDARAISYAESFMSFIEHYGLGEIVGQPTAGANGNINGFTLPGGYNVTWTGMRVVKHDGSQHHLIGILPTVPVKRTVAGVRDHRDECIERALALITGSR